MTTKTEVLDAINMAILFNDNMLLNADITATFPDKVLSNLLKDKRASLQALKVKITARKRL